LEEYENVNFYSFQFENETHAEFEKFLIAFNESHAKDIGTIMYRLERITEDGVFPSISDMQENPETEQQNYQVILKQQT